MTQDEKLKEQQMEFNSRVREVIEFAKSKQIEIFAIQQITKEGYIETIPMFRNLKTYPVKKTNKKK